MSDSDVLDLTGDAFPLPVATSKKRKRSTKDDDDIPAPKRAKGRNNDDDDDDFLDAFVPRVAQKQRKPTAKTLMKQRRRTAAEAAVRAAHPTRTVLSVDIGKKTFSYALLTVNVGTGANVTPDTGRSSVTLHVLATVNLQSGVVELAERNPRTNKVQHTTRQHVHAFRSQEPGQPVHLPVVPKDNDNNNDDDEDGPKKKKKKKKDMTPQIPFFQLVDMVQEFVYARLVVPYLTDASPHPRVDAVVVERQNLENKEMTVYAIACYTVFRALQLHHHHAASVARPFPTAYLQYAGRKLHVAARTQPSVRQLQQQQLNFA